MNNLDPYDSEDNVVTNPNQNMKDPNLILGTFTLVLTAIATGWPIWNFWKKLPYAAISRGNVPATKIVLEDEDGIEYSPKASTGRVTLPWRTIGTLVIVRDLDTHMELLRFVVQAGRNEIGL
jgi:hypothetical protein